MRVLDRETETRALARMKKLGPGMYADDKGTLHVSSSELLAYFGVPYTPENEDALAKALHQVAAHFRIPRVEEVRVVGR